MIDSCTARSIQVTLCDHRRRPPGSRHRDARLLESVANHLGELRPDPGEALPALGQVIIRALTYSGRSGQAPEDNLGNRRHSLAPVFYAGQEVITQLRLIDEARTAGRQVIRHASLGEPADCGHTDDRIPGRAR
jgi:hypothetical protein